MLNKKFELCPRGHLHNVFADLFTWATNNHVLQRIQKRSSLEVFNCNNYRQGYDLRDLKLTRRPVVMPSPLAEASAG